MYSLEMSKKLLEKLKKIPNLVWISSNKIVPGWNGNYFRERPKNIHLIEKYSDLFAKELPWVIDLNKWTFEEVKKYTCDNMHLSKEGNEYIYKELMKIINLKYKNLDTLVVMGNGASLKNVDINHLRYFDCFGLNMAHRIYDKLSFYPKYFGCFDFVVTKSHKENFQKIINEMPIKRFFFIKNLFSGDNFTYIKLNTRTKEKEFTKLENIKNLWNFGNSGTNACHIGIALGYKKILLTGVDCNYIDFLPEAELQENKSLKIVKMPEKNPNYWFDYYQRVGDIYNIPNAKIYHQPAWELLSEMVKEKNIDVINCSEGSTLKCFPNSTINKELTPLFLKDIKKKLKSKNVSIVFNVKYNEDNPNLLSNLNYTIKWFMEEYKNHDFKYFIIEQNVINKIPEIPEIEKIFLYNPNYFNRGWGFNVFVKYFMKTDIAVFCDADIILDNPNALIKSIEISRKEKKLVSPYGFVHFTDIKERGIIMKENRKINLKSHHPVTIAGGITTINKETFLNFGGFEEYRVYGGEDRALDVVFMKENLIDTIPGFGIHLYHPVNKKKSDETIFMLNHLTDLYGCKYDPGLKAEDFIHKNCKHNYNIEEHILEKKKYFGNPDLNHLKNLSINSFRTNFYVFNKKTVFVKTFNEDVSFFVDKVVKNGEYLYLITKENGIMYRNLYNEEFWNSLIKDLNDTTKIYETELDIVNFTKFKKLADTLPEEKKLQKGISFLIRAKNEEKNVEFLLTSLNNILKKDNVEAIFINNNSSDKTYEKVCEVCKNNKTKNVYLYNYEVDVAKCGDEHSKLSAEQMYRSLDTYYNWCVDKATKNFIIKWDADFVCIEDNLLEMIEKYDLLNSEENISIWFSGKTIFTKNDDYYINIDTMYNEFRLFSKKHGAKWDYARNWEIISKKYLENSTKLIYSKAVFLEVKTILTETFKSRSNNEKIKNDIRDEKDYHIFQKLTKDNVNINYLKDIRDTHYENLFKLNFNPLTKKNFNNKILTELECNYAELIEMQHYWLNNYTGNNKNNFKNKENIIIQGLWVGNELTDIHLMCLNSFLKLGHCFVLYTYEEIINLPKNVVTLNGDNIIPKSLIYKFNDSYAGFSDLFRNFLLYLKGGWYVDLDIYCLQKYDFETNLIFSSDYYHETAIDFANKEKRLFKEKYYIPTNPIKSYKFNNLFLELYIFIFKKILFSKIYDEFKHKDINNFYDYLESLNLKYDYEKYLVKVNLETNIDEILKNNNIEKKDIGQNSWGELGPLLLTKKIIEENLDVFVTEPEILQGKIKYYEVEKYVDEEFNYREILENKNIYSLDLFFTMWKNKNLFDIKDLKENTFFKHLKYYY
jgi:hypothetical protein